MLRVVVSHQFKRDYKKAVARGLDVGKLEKVITLLREESELPPEYKDHRLRDDRLHKSLRECHIQPDWLLIYRIIGDELVLFLFRTGTHGELLDK